MYETAQLFVNSPRVKSATKLHLLMLRPVPVAKPRASLLRNEFHHSCSLTSGTLVLKNACGTCEWRAVMTVRTASTLFSQGSFKAGPLDLSFWSFLTFLHHRIEKVERHLLWKFHKKIRRKSWSNEPLKLLAYIRFLYKVVHKIGRLRKFNRSREIEFNFFTAWTIFMKLGTLVHHVNGYKSVASEFLIFAYGLSYGLSKSKIRGKIVTKLWKIITKSQGKNKKSEAKFCRSALLLSFCENRLCLSQLIKKLNSTERGALFDIFASPRWSAPRMRTKVVSFLIFFSRAFKQKKKWRLYDQRWLK